MIGPSRGAPVWTYDDYARLPDDGDRHEVIRGELLVTPGPTPRHQWVAYRLHRALSDYVERHGLGVVLHEVDLLFEPGDFVRPDLLFVPKDRLASITARGVECVPELVVEVVSPGSSRVDRTTKPARFRELGVPMYWIVDPESRVVEVCVGQRSQAPLIVADTLRWQPDPAVTPALIEVPPLFEAW
jgi:Uma2 family endonuclease